MESGQRNLLFKMKNNMYTIGVEEEFMICNPKTGDLINRADSIMNSIKSEHLDRFSYELILSEIESNTSINDNVRDTVDEILKLRNMLKDIGNKNDFALGVSGTHPTAKTNDQVFVDNESYNWVSNQLKYYATKNITFSTHVHIGLNDKDKMIYITNSLRRWIAPMLALTSNSPFFEGKLTGMKSARTFQFGLFPRTEIPNYIESYDSFLEIVDKYSRTNSISKPRHIWWKIRPHLDFNTVEFRVCDAQRSIDKIEMIIAILQALVRSIDIKKDYHLEYNYEYLTDGLWKASSLGIDSKIIDPYTKKILSMNEMVRIMIEYCKDSLKYFNNAHVIKEVDNILDTGTEADQQISCYEKLGMEELKLFLINQVNY